MATDDRLNPFYEAMKGAVEQGEAAMDVARLALVDMARSPLGGGLAEHMDRVLADWRAEFHLAVTNVIAALETAVTVPEWPAAYWQYRGRLLARGKFLQAQVESARARFDDDSPVVQRRIAIYEMLADGALNSYAEFKPVWDAWCHMQSPACGAIVDTGSWEALRDRLLFPDGQKAGNLLTEDHLAG